MTTKTTTYSAQYLFMACRAEVGDPMAKLVLIALADRANDAGECWPSLETIAKQCECHRRTVERALNKLQEKGLIQRINRADGNMKTSNLYRITLDAAQSRIDAAQSRNPLGTESHKAPIEAPIYIYRPAWAEWVAYRKERRKAVTPSTAAKQFKFLSAYSEAEQQSIIDQSIQNGWTGLFPPKETGNGQAKPVNAHGRKLSGSERTRLARERAYQEQRHG